MKKIVLPFLLLLTVGLYAQKPISTVNTPISKLDIMLYPHREWNSKLRICNTLEASPCSNLIANNNFTPGPGYDGTPNSGSSQWGDPFGTNFITNWVAATGSPNVDDIFAYYYGNTTVTPPAPATGMAFLTFLGTQQGESIAQNIAQVKAGKKYLLSFSKMLSPYIDYGHPQTHTFKIVLMTCRTFGTLDTGSDGLHIPAVPANSQTIYCEVNPTNMQWQQNVTSFTANADYNMMWIFAQGTGFSSTSGGVDFAYPELIDINSFSAGPTPAFTPGSCTLTIGPATPNCSVYGAVFTWHGPQGQVIPAAANQQLQVNASTDFGTWTLEMAVPGNIVPTNTCTTLNNVVSASVLVPQCGNPILPTTISSESYYARNDCLVSGGTTVNYPIIPATENHFCSYWECGGFSHFFSNVPNTTTNEWYVNDILVPSLGNSPAYGSVQITNSGELIHGPGNERFFKIQVKNTTFGSQQLSDPTYIYYAGTIGFSNGIGPFTESAGDYKPGYTGIYTIPRGNHSGPNTTYTWSIPNCTVTNIDPSGFTVQIIFSSGLPTSGISGTLNIQNSYCENGTIPITFYYNSTLRGAIPENDNSSSIYPNPASNTLNIFSNQSKIISIDIYNLSGTLIKRIKTMPAEKIELKVSTLKQGIYNCRITTETGIENQKFIIKR